MDSPIDPEPSKLRATIALTILLAAGALATSRLGLVLHELGGHGGTVKLCGGTISEVRLFWFAGGWIRYVVPDISSAQQLVISLGGIAIETVTGVTLWLALRSRGDLPSRLARTIGAALVTHAMTYLAGGAWHGYGDGHAIHEIAGDARYPIAVLAGVAACAAAFVGARYLFATLVANTTMPAALVAIVIATGANVALGAAELHVRRDRTYAEVMTPERARVVEREMAAWQSAHPEEDAAAAAQEQQALERRNADFPFIYVLVVFLATALLAGAARSPRMPRTHITLRQIAGAFAIAAAATGLVILL